MSKVNEIARTALTASQKQGPDDTFYKYYLSEEMPKTQYTSEGLVVFAPEITGADMIFAMMLIDVTPNPAFDYYHAILAANLPTRAVVNEKLYNEPLDEEGILAAAEFQLARRKALLETAPLVAATLYREVNGTDLLVELLSINPLRPSIALARFKDRIRTHLHGKN